MLELLLALLFAMALGVSVPLVARWLDRPGEIDPPGLWARYAIDEDYFTDESGTRWYPFGACLVKDLRSDRRLPHLPVTVDEPCLDRHRNPIYGEMVSDGDGLLPPFYAPQPKVVAWSEGVEGAFTLATLAMPRLILEGRTPDA